MEEPKRIASLAQIRGLDDTILSGCYVIGLGYSGCTVLSELPVAVGTPVFADFTFLNPGGDPEAETVSGKVVVCEEGRGVFRIGLAFAAELTPADGSRLAAFILREEAENRSGPLSRPHEAGAGSA